MPGVVTFVSAGDVPGANRRLWFNNPEELFAEEEVLLVKYQCPEGKHQKHIF